LVPLGVHLWWSAVARGASFGERAQSAMIERLMLNSPSAFERRGVEPSLWLALWLNAIFLAPACGGPLVTRPVADASPGQDADGEDADVLTGSDADTLPPSGDANADTPPDADSTGPCVPDCGSNTCGMDPVCGILNCGDCPYGACCFGECNEYASCCEDSECFEYCRGSEGSSCDTHSERDSCEGLDGCEWDEGSSTCWGSPSETCDEISTYEDCTNATGCEPTGYCDMSTGGMSY